MKLKINTNKHSIKVNTKKVSVNEFRESIFAILYLIKKVMKNVDDKKMEAFANVLHNDLDFVLLGEEQLNNKQFDKIFK